MIFSMIVVGCCDVRIVMQLCLCQYVSHFKALQEPAAVEVARLKCVVSGKNARRPSWTKLQMMMILLELMIL